MKKLLVIGAGVAQKDAIIQARNAGYELYVSDGNPSAPGFSEAHAYKIIDVTDAEANLEWAKQIGIDGVLSFASDITLPSVLAVRESLKLPGLCREAMDISLNKARQRVVFGEAKLSQPAFRFPKTEEEAFSVALDIGYPVIIKPVDNAGSRGVALLENESIMVTAFREAINQSKKGDVIIEKCEKGTELTVEGFSVNGEHHILAISDKFKPIPCVATQLAYPAMITPEQENAVKELMSAAYDAAGIDNTPTHSEVILTDDGPKIVEIGCRGGGFYVFSLVVGFVSGYDIVANWARLCAGDPVEKPVLKRKGVVLRFMIAEPGKLLGVSGIDEANKLDGVMAGSFYKIGESVPRFQNDGTRTGWMITMAETREKALEKADMVSNMVRFSTENPD